MLFFDNFFMFIKTANIVRVGSVESVISVNRSSEHPECKHPSSHTFIIALGGILKMFSVHVW